MCVQKGRRRLREVGPVQAALPVDVGGEMCLPYERPVAAGGDRDVGPSGKLEDPSRVDVGPGERRVAVDRGDGTDVEVARGEQDGEGVVVAGIAVDDDGGAGGLGHQTSFASGSVPRMPAWMAQAFRTAAAMAPSIQRRAAPVAGVVGEPDPVRPAG